MIKKDEEKEGDIEVPQELTGTEALAAKMSAECDKRVNKLAEMLAEAQLKVYTYETGFMQIGRQFQQLVADFNGIKTSLMSATYAAENFENNVMQFAQTLNAAMPKPKTRKAQ